MDDRVSLPTCAPPDPDPRRPQMTLPHGSCDCHCHVLGPFDQFPPPPDRAYNPAEAPETALRSLHEKLGLDRAVIVHAQGHGSDHRPLLTALKTGAGRYRGVAALTPLATPAEVASLDQAGVCGVRFTFMSHLGGRLDAAGVRAVAALVRPFGWHACLHLAGTGVVEHSDLIRSLDGPIVLDHMARIDIGQGVTGPAVSAMLRLLDTGSVWVKLSGAERLSSMGSPYTDVVPIASLLARHAPERVLWGSDWPHVNLTAPMPNDGDLVDLITQIAPDDSIRRKMMVDNPAELFGF